MTKTSFTTFALAFLFAFGLVLAATETFPVSTTVANSAPTITWVNSSFSITGTVDSTESFQFHFNATDANGFEDINDSTATIVISLGVQTATSSACTPTDNDPTITYNCSIDIPYYYNASASWSINASVSDLGDNYVENTSETFTLNTLLGIALTEASLSFSSLTPGSTDNAATENPQRIRNTGNFDFPEVNVTGFNLLSGGDTIGAGNFTINITNSGGAGQTLTNNTPITITNADMTHGQNTNETLYLYLDVPTGTPQGTYNSQSNWIIDVN